MAAKAAAPASRGRVHDWYAFTLSFKGVLLEGLEVVFIVITFGANQHDVGAAVIGAGTMGAQIAAHLANAGVRTLLLDLTVEIASEGLKRALALRPDPFFTTDAAALVTAIAALHADAPRVEETDWVQIVEWYDELLRFVDTPIVRLNRAVAVGDVTDAARRLSGGEPARRAKGEAPDGALDVVLTFPGGGAQYPGMAADLALGDGLGTGLGAGLLGHGPELIGRARRAAPAGTPAGP